MADQQTSTPGQICVEINRALMCRRCAAGKAGEGRNGAWSVVAAPANPLLK